jgi:hypothetical protein
MKEFLELLIEMKMKMIVSENFLLLTIRGIIVSLMLDVVIFLSEMIVLSLIKLQMMILEILMIVEIRVILEVTVEMILFVIQILMTLVMNNHENFVQNQSLLNE